MGADGVVRLWDVKARGMCIAECKIGDAAFALGWHPGGEELVVVRKDDVVMRIGVSAGGAGSTMTGQVGVNGTSGGGVVVQMTVLAHHAQSTQTNALAFSNAETELLLTTGDSSVRILDYPTLSHLHTLHPHTSSITCVAVSPSGRHLAFGGSDAIMTVWETAELTCRHSIPEMGGPVRNVGFSFDGSYLVGGVMGDEVAAAPGYGGYGTAPTTGGEGTGIKVWHVETREEVCEIPTSVPVPVVCWHPGRYVLAWGGEAGGVRVLGLGSAGL